MCNMCIEEEIPRIIMKCEECGRAIFDDDENIYFDNDNNYFCSLECALSFHGIYESEGFRRK